MASKSDPASALERIAQAVRSGHRDRARRLRKQLIQSLPERADALRSVAIRSAQSGDVVTAGALFRAATRVAPTDVDAWLDLAKCESVRQRPAKAAAAYGHAVELAPERVELHLQLGLTHGKAQQEAELVAVCERAIERFPDDVRLHLLHGQGASLLGRTEVAAASYRRVLELDPKRGEAWWMLASTVGERFTDADVASMEAMRGRCTGDAETSLCFALASAYRARGEHGRAFDALVDGNRRKAATLPTSAYDAALVERAVDAGIETFDASFFAERAGGGAGPASAAAPIFVLSMPRAGSTLVEQILASHPDVTGGGELEITAAMSRKLAPSGEPDAFPRAAAALSVDDLRELGSSFVERALERLGDGVVRFTDKSLNNYALLGFLHVALPNAKFVSVRREPMATGLSCFEQLFVGAEHPYSYDLAQLGHFSRQYARFMDHWRDVLGDAFLEVDYEDLVRSQEDVTRRIVAFCGLEWDERCLRFHETSRTVRTLSVAQVRQPLYAGSLERWRHYEQRLAPLRAALDAS